VITTEIEVRKAELALLDLEMASASDLVATDRVTLRKLRHADEELPLPYPSGKTRRRPKARGRTAKA
jgi:hypothetical protein